MFPTPWLNVGTPGVRSKGWGVPFPLLLWTPPGKLLEAFVPRVQRLPGVQRCSQPATAAAWYHWLTSALSSSLLNLSPTGDLFTTASAGAGLQP